jgi:hypothetical protein
VFCGLLSVGYVGFGMILFATTDVLRITTLFCCFLLRGEVVGVSCVVLGDPKVFFSLHILSGGHELRGTRSEILRPPPPDRKAGVNRVLGEETETDRMEQGEITGWNANEHKTVDR